MCNRHSRSRRRLLPPPATNDKHYNRFKSSLKVLKMKSSKQHLISLWMAFLLSGLFPSLVVVATTTSSNSRHRFTSHHSSFLTITQNKNNNSKLLHSPLSSASSSWQRIPRGGEQQHDHHDHNHDHHDHNHHVEPSIVPASTIVAATSLPGIVVQAWTQMLSSFRGGKSDTLLLLAVTFLVPTICNSINTSPILGFLCSGVVLGPQCCNYITDVHTTELLADLGVVLFLFEMGVHLSLPVLWEMRSIVFGLGGAQMACTSILVAIVAKLCGLSTAAQVVLGGGLALSSSAFVLQLLKDKNELETVKGKHSFGVLLLQDLAVVPLLVVTPLLAGKSCSVGTAVLTACIQFIMAISVIGLFGKFAMEPLFETVLKKSRGSQEASIAISLATILGMSFFTQGLGLSNTLGAFLAGVLLSETSFRHTVEKEVSPIRGILVGLFFFSVGFEIDLPLLASSKIKTVATIVVGLMMSKMVIITGLCKAFGLDLATSQNIGCILSQGGEFAFVAFRLARSLGIFDAELTKLLLTCVAVTMALTPLVKSIGSGIAENMMMIQQNNNQQSLAPPAVPVMESSASIETVVPNDKKEN